MTGRVAVLGAGGYVGSAVCRELRLRDWEVIKVRAPRVGNGPLVAPAGGAAALRRARVVEALAIAIGRVDAVVNAAGLANPAGSDVGALTSANSVLPRLVADACALAWVDRLVHVSSAAVQGDLSPLDESMHYRAASPYARTKMRGEEALCDTAAVHLGVRTVVLRPTSVHGAGRMVTRRLIQLARSPFVCVVAPGDDPTPQVLVENVGATVEYLCRPDVTPPPIVLQPWEGWTTSSFLHLLSGRWPPQIPASFGRTLLRLAGMTSQVGPRLAYRRRLELLWCGQPQVPGWLATIGFSPPYGRDHWERLVYETGGGRR